ncbi:UDP-4-amino-4,6-dideoxy-N-acetyl-beta-L-altrosamine transaminase [Marivirga sp.]|uniref:UDP-4-amino-4, 6-dideoxy-N-acetyl-beta-L-altrosamine transaminase n=1 Tax=Marivirga sp. TaxID=2018662 RepID=UPI0025F9FAFD|nr:UDP-4-amino-4,6-dideoxy-N-acetyl-beta-L-altrosamine transaminase [Marivirga sp.]
MSKNIIPYGKQSISQADIDAVTETLKSDFLTQGPKVKAFETAFAEYIGSKYAVAVANGTAALHLNCLALNLKAGQKVITTPITFAASANCVKYCGGEVLFADIDPKTYLIDIDSVRKLLEKDSDIVGIIPVDFAGRAVDMEAFKNLADQYNCWIIEDSCHSPGGYFVDANDQKQNCGNGQFADLAIFSFHPVKHIAAGEGGMITTNDKSLYEKLLILRTHGITKDSDQFQNSMELAIAQSPDDNSQWPAWYMEMQELGYNYRLSDIHAALGLSQLEKADQGLKKRIEIAKKYNEAFEGQDFIKGHSGLVDGHAYHLYVLEVDDRYGLFNYLREHDIYAQIHYIPLHLMPYYQSQGWKQGDFPHAENYYKNCISIPMYPGLTDEEQNFVIETIKTFYNG